MKTHDLTGAALDWAVAKCEGLQVYIAPKVYVYTHIDEEGFQHAYEPSKRWAQGGPIIEREKIKITYEKGGVCLAGKFNGVCYAMNYSGETFLIAAMRCYVASKLGDEVEIPKELS